MSDLESLLSRARSAEPDLSRLEFAFETRLLARLREERGSSILEWAWRLCPGFAVLSLAVLLWGHFFPGSAFDERQLVTEAGLRGEEQTLYAYMTGAQEALR